MKQNIHPKYEAVQVKCSCGNTFATRSTIAHDISVEICSNCHPFFTGQQRVIDTGGRVQRFRDRYAKKKAGTPAESANDSK